jgi:hypothetical protein
MFTRGLSTQTTSGFTAVRGQAVSGIGGAVFAICMLVGAGLSGLMEKPWPILIGALAGVYFLFAIKVAQQWERAAVLRLGRYRGLMGPG